jgi:putative phosphoesterase
MKIALLSDIHSNIYALDAVLNQCVKEEADQYFILGDLFSYYPWAVEVFHRLKALGAKAKIIKGNHDDFILHPETVKREHFYSGAVLQNVEALRALGDEPFAWLSQLSHQETVTVDRLSFTLVHGTPDDPSRGRFYPDNKALYPWFPSKDHFLLMGHTHYPIMRKIENGGYILNPGSVGQPRDGNPDASWMMLDTETLKIVHFRTSYDRHYVSHLLNKMQWEPKAIAALNKSQ